MAQRESRLVRVVPAPAFIQVKGTDRKTAKDIQKQLSPLIDKPIDTPRLEEKLTQQVGGGRFSGLSYSFIDDNGKKGLLISAEEKD